MYGGQSHVWEPGSSVPLIVVEGNGPSLLGRDWLRHITLNWHEICRVLSMSVQAVLEKNQCVFQKGLGKLQNFTAKIYVDPKVQARFCKARPVPYAMTTEVEKELQWLVEEGILEPVELSEWAASIVTVLKKDRSGVWICGDFRQTVNPISRLDRYPIPRVEDLLATLAKGESFSKIDLSHAYQQLSLDEESRQYVVINIHKVFKSLKVHWSAAYHQYMVDNPGCVITKFWFSGLFREAWLKSIKPEIVVVRQVSILEIPMQLVHQLLMHLQ